MDNKKLPISGVLAFAEKATQLGCYTKTQRYNFGTAWSILLEHLAAVDLTLSSTVEQLQPKIADLLAERGRKTKVNAKSLRAYEARIKKLLADYVKWNGSDFMKWKQEIEKSSSNSDAKSQKRRKAARPRANSSDVEDDVDSITHRLIANEGKEGKIILPNDLSEQEIETIWAQLGALQSLIKAQAAALKGKTAKAPNA